jgi:hypothetical protein
VLDRLLRLVPPSIDRPSPSELWDLLRLGKDIRGLGRERLYQVLRWGPMAVADFAAEWCETPLLRAVVAARGTFGANAGPWSAGTTLGWMLQAASERHPAGAPSFVVGGPARSRRAGRCGDERGRGDPHQRGRRADRGG